MEKRGFVEKLPQPLPRPSFDFPEPRRPFARLANLAGAPGEPPAPLVAGVRVRSRRTLFDEDDERRPSICFNLSGPCEWIPFRRPDRWPSPVSARGALRERGLHRGPAQLPFPRVFSIQKFLFQLFENPYSVTQY